MRSGVNAVPCFGNKTEKSLIYAMYKSGFGQFYLAGDSSPLFCFIFEKT
jgi:hypothetical protein